MLNLNYTDDVRGEIIGQSKTIGALYYEGRSQSMPVYGASLPELRVILQAERARLLNDFPFIYTEENWEIRYT